MQGSTRAEGYVCMWLNWQRCYRGGVLNPSRRALYAGHIWKLWFRLRVYIIRIARHKGAVFGGDSVAVHETPTRFALH